MKFLVFLLKTKKRKKNEVQVGGQNSSLSNIKSLLPADGRGGDQLRAAIGGGAVNKAAEHIPVPAARQALLDAYQSAFTSTFDHLMWISTAVALVGSIGSLILVRQKDFVPSWDAGQAPGGAPEGAPAPAAAH